MKFGLTDDEIRAIRKVFMEEPAVEEVILFGSRAKGNYRPGSDIDFCLKGSLIDHSVKASLAFALDDLLMPFHIDLLTFHSISNQDLLAHIERVGVLFYKKGTDTLAMAS